MERIAEIRELLQVVAPATALQALRAALRRGVICPEDLLRDIRTLAAFNATANPWRSPADVPFTLQALCECGYRQHIPARLWLHTGDWLSARLPKGASSQKPSRSPHLTEMVRKLTIIPDVLASTLRHCRNLEKSTDGVIWRIATAQACIARDQELAERLLPSAGDTVAAALLQNLRGIPEHPYTTDEAGTWIEQLCKLGRNLLDQLVRATATYANPHWREALEAQRARDDKAHRSILHIFGSQRAVAHRLLVKTLVEATATADEGALARIAAAAQALGIPEYFLGMQPSLDMLQCVRESAEILRQAQQQGVAGGATQRTAQAALLYDDLPPGIIEALFGLWLSMSTDTPGEPDLRLALLLDENMREAVLLRQQFMI